MRVFHCDKCGSTVYFENRMCGVCESRLGFSPERLDLIALQMGIKPGEWKVLAGPRADYRFCANAEWDACNWLVPAVSDEQYCAACRHNRTIPSLQDEEHVRAWRLFEGAKHRLFYSVLRLRLPVESRKEDPENGLAFDFLEEAAGARVTTGHDHGLITLNLREADDAERARIKRELGEPYRTLLGHFRHESGHYFWDRLVKDKETDRFREVFGDEQKNYGGALNEYYAGGPPTDWSERFVSAYASAHPWEDFAETWAHYLHIVDTMEMARSFELRAGPPRRLGVNRLGVDKRIGFSSEPTPEFSDFIGHWGGLTIVLNSLNRCMGQADVYPFVLAPAVMGKLEFVHRLIAQQRERKPNLKQRALTGGNAPAKRVMGVQN